MNTSTTTVSTQALTAARAAVGLLPAATALTVVDPVSEVSAASIPGKAIVAQFAGAAHGVIALVVGQDLVEALAQAPMGALDLTQAIRPALEAAAATLGPVVVDPGEVVEPSEALDSVLAGGGVLVPLAGSGRIQAVVALAVSVSVAGSGSASGLGSNPGSTGKARGLDLLHDVEMEVTAELGRARMTVKKLLELLPGNIVELDRAAGGPADLLVNGRMIARGEVVVIDENFGIRITEIIPQSDRP
jgi:flagellar motor switch protein FliN/FliY